MKIVILDFDDTKNPLLNAGQARSTFEVGKRLVKKGHMITVISSKYPGSSERVDNGISYKHIGLGSANIKLNNLIYILSLPFTVRKLKADIIVECFTAPMSTLFSPLFTKIPVVAIPTMFSADQFAQKYHLPFDLIENIGCRFYKYFMPYTEYFDQKMKKINRRITSKIVTEGVGEEYFKIQKKKAKHILFLGRLDVYQKGLDLLLQAYQKSVREISYPLIIAGFGPDERKIRKMIINLGLQNKVKMVGPAYDKKKFKLLSQSAFVAFPSRWEGFSLFVLEAMACGLPLAAFDIQGLSWANGLVSKASAFDVSQYSFLLKKYSNMNLTRSLSESLRTFARSYTWDNVADQYADFFAEILENESMKTPKL